MVREIKEADRATRLFNCAVWNEERANELRWDAAHLKWSGPDADKKAALYKDADRLEKQAAALFDESDLFERGIKA